MRPLIKPNQIKDLSAIEFTLKIDGEVRQQGHTNEMITAITPLLEYISQHFTLMPGDVVLTGTPAGVGPVQVGDVLEGFVEGEQLLKCAVK